MAWDINWSQSQIPDFAGNAIKYRAAGQADQLARQKLAVQTKVATQYGGGDAAGARQTALAGGDIDLAASIDKLGDADRERAAATVSGVANILAGVKALPYDQRKPAIQARSADLVKIGYKPEQIAAFDPTDAAIDERLNEALGFKGVLERADSQRTFDANQAQRRFENAQPRYQAVVPGGKVIPIAPVNPDAPPGPAPQAIDGPPGAGPSPTAGAPSDGRPRSVRNNNPGNIEDGPFAQSLPGYKGSDGRFAIFETPEAGTGGQVALLGSYGKRGINTVSAIINRWAPPSDGNNTPAYVRYVAGRIGVGPDQTLDMTDPATLSDIATAIQQFEGGPQSASNDRPPPQAGVARSAPQARPGDPPGTIYGDPKPASRRLTPQEVAAAGYQPGSVVVVDSNGEETVKQGPGGGSGKITDGMRQVASYAKDMVDGVGQLNQLAARGIYKPTARILISEKNGVTRLVARDPRDAQFVQAANAVLIPLLRKETGAAVTAPELSLYLDTYVAQPSDGQEVIRQKAAALQSKIGTLLQQSRPAYEDQFGAIPKVEMRTPGQGPAAKPPSGARKGGNGKFYIQHPSKPGSFPEVKQAPDGNWYIEPTPGKFMKVVG